MGIATAMEIDDVQPVVSYSRIGYDNSSELWTETDWTGLLPQWAKASLQQTTQMAGLRSYSSKVRLVEAVLFTLTILFIIYSAAASS